MGTLRIGDLAERTGTSAPTIEQVRALIAVTRDPDSSCMVARDLAADHLVLVRQKLQDLEALERSLARFVRSCDDSCAGGPGQDCVILENLGGCGCSPAPGTVRAR